MTEQQATPHRPAGDERYNYNSDTQSDRARIDAAASDHLWDATIEGVWMSEYCKGEHTVQVYWNTEDGSAREVTYYRGDIGLAYLAPADGVADAAVNWLSGRSV